MWRIAGRRSPLADRTPEDLKAWLDFCASDPELGEAVGNYSEEEPFSPPDEDLAVSPTAPAPPPTGPPWNIHSTPSLFTDEVVEVPQLIPDLDLGPGRPCGLVGGPGAGKSDAAQSIALAVVAGVPAFGRFPTTQGRVLHLSYDLGLDPVRIRYRRIANGMGLDLAQVEGLDVAVYPQIYLTSPKALAAFADIFEGYSLIVLDNLREVTPNVDENDSRIGRYLTLLGAAAAVHGATALYLHHSRNAAQGPDQGASRGSGAIVAATGSLWMIDGVRDKPRRMIHVRQGDISDGVKSDFYLVKEPATGGLFETGDHPSYRLAARTKEELASARKSDAAARVHHDKILDLLFEAKPQGLSHNKIQDLYGGRKDGKTVKAVLQSLISDGKISQNDDLYFYVEA